MSLTRNWLSALGIEADKVEEIIKGHAETVDGLKDELEKYKADAKKLPEVTAELEKLKEAVKNDRTDELQKKYDKLKADFDEYKSDIEAKATKRTKTDAFKKLLKDANISDKRFDSIIKVSGDMIDKIEFDEDNNIVDPDKVTESIKDEWSDFIVSEGKMGASTPKPPANNGGGTKTKEEIMAIKDTAERQQAIADNHELFGF